jgi:hypothetical protein
MSIDQQNAVTVAGKFSAKSTLQSILISHNENSTRKWTNIKSTKMLVDFLYHLVHYRIAVSKDLYNAVTTTPAALYMVDAD